MGRLKQANKATPLLKASGKNSSIGGSIKTTYGFIQSYNVTSAATELLLGALNLVLVINKSCIRTR